MKRTLIIITALLSILSASADSHADSTRVYLSVSIAGAVGGIFWYISYTSSVSKDSDDEIKVAAFSDTNNDILSDEDAGNNEAPLYLPLYTYNF